MERLFLKVKSNLGPRNGASVFNRCLNGAVCFVLPRVPAKFKELKETDLAKKIKASGISGEQYKKSLAIIFSSLKKTQKKRSPEQFGCGKKWQGLCYPLISRDKVFGFVILCGLKKTLSGDSQDMFAALIDTLVNESRREVELERMNERVKPRAIALSTVHTVHRLMASTLDLSELLPRIARLSLQLLRANRCSIKLVDKKRKILLPMATIDLRKKKTRLKKVRIGKYAPGRAVKQEVPIRGENYLASPMIDKEVVGVITLYDKIDGRAFTQFDEEIMKTLSEQAAIAVKNAQLFKEQADLTLSSIRCIARLLEDRPHSVQRAEASSLKLINIMGPKLNMNESEIKMLQYAAMLHDAGQISIPEKVLMKKGGLTGREYNIMKTHPLKGSALLSKFKPLKPIVPIILYHHENFNGTGYPKGLKGRDIPLAARVLAVVGDFEAMITEKPYRRALSIENAVREVKKNAGVQFDPHVVKIFCEAIQRKDVRKLLEKELRKT
ncbi:MAG: HD domain-containing phosphohydrolase [Candidatus Omnitrophota bacterium]